MLRYIESGKSDGAKIHIGGERHGNQGYFIKPTIFVDVKHDMKIMQEEIFGPVCSIVKFKTEEGMSPRIYYQEVGLLNGFVLQRLPSGPTIPPTGFLPTF